MIDRLLFGSIVILYLAWYALMLALAVTGLSRCGPGHCL